MKELLQQWAELEPERCYRDDGFWIRIEGSEGYKVQDNQDNRAQSLALIQFAVQNAIAAQGCYFSLFLGEDIDEARIQARNGLEVGRGIVRKKDGESKLAEALLKAHLRALEIIRE